MKNLVAEHIDALPTLPGCTPRVDSFTFKFPHPHSGANRSQLDPQPQPRPQALGAHLNTRERRSLTAYR